MSLLNPTSPQELGRHFDHFLPPVRMRVEWRHGHHILCGVVLPANKLKPGQVWVAGGLPVTIISVDHNGWVTYEGVAQQRWEKDAFSFQCRYCLVVPTNKIPEELL